MDKITRREAIEKTGRLVLGATGSLYLGSTLAGCSDQSIDPESVARVMEGGQKAELSEIKLTVVYDNMHYKKGLKAGWGFSCLVQGLDKTILFDAGEFGDTLMSNMKILGLDPGEVEELVISHDHDDHVGGAQACLKHCKNPGVSVVRSFSSIHTRAFEQAGAHVREVTGPCRITRNCISTGEMKSLLKNEHGLIILTDQGSILITGCAHPGVADMAERAIQITGDELLLVMGGFHLFRHMNSKIRKTAQKLKDLGVRYVAPSHCTGTEAGLILLEAFGDNCLDSGVGRVITASELKG